MQKIKEPINEYSVNKGTMKIVKVDDFKGDTARVMDKSGLFNFITTKLELLSPNIWFSFVSDFSNGFSKVRNAKGSWNFLSKDGNILSPKFWFKAVKIFNEKTFAVQNDKGLWNLLTTDGCFIFTDWFKKITTLNENDLFLLNRDSDDLYNIANIQGTILCDTWLSSISNFKNTIAIVQNSEGLFNLLSNKGKLLSNVWFKSICTFSNGVAIVQNTEGLFNYISISGEIIYPDLWFYKVFDFQNNMSKVLLSKTQVNILFADGKLLNKNGWFSDVNAISDTLFTVKDEKGIWHIVNKNCDVINKDLKLKSVSGNYGKNMILIESDDGLWNAMDLSGNLVSPNLWFKEILSYENGFLHVSLGFNNHRYVSLKTGVITEKEYKQIKKHSET